MSDMASAQRRERLSPSEKRFLISHPHLVLRISQNAYLAEQEADRRGYRQAQRGVGDAFHSCYWSALLARDIGVEQAQAFFKAHGEREDAEPGAASIELRNSSVGISIGRSHPGASNKALANRCAWALEVGRLRVAPHRN